MTFTIVTALCQKTVRPNRKNLDRLRVDTQIESPARNNNTQPLPEQKVGDTIRRYGIQGSLWLEKWLLV